jgi:hypothetical protein
MELRDHRLMSYRGVPNWPPVWVRIKTAAEQQILRGEIGVLQQHALSMNRKCCVRNRRSREETKGA